MGSLYTYELQVLAEDNPGVSQKGKSVAFTADANTNSNTENLDDEIQKFHKVLAQHITQLVQS